MARKPRAAIPEYTGRGPRLSGRGADGVGITLALDSRDLRRLGTLQGVSRVMAAKALTFTAEKSVQPWRRAHGVFMRRNSWIDKGVTHRQATAGNLSARVGTVDKYMSRHVIGLGEDKDGRLFVPTYPGGSIRQVGTHTQIRRRLRGIDRTKRKTFRITTASGKVLIARRKGKARTPLEILGKVQDGANVTPELDALGVVTRVTRAEFPRTYERLLLRWAETGRV